MSDIDWSIRLCPVRWSVQAQTFILLCGCNRRLFMSKPPFLLLKNRPWTAPSCMCCSVLHQKLFCSYVWLLRPESSFFLSTPINNAPWKTKKGQTPNLICICELARGCRANVSSSHIKDLTWFRAWKHENLEYHSHHVRKRTYDTPRLTIYLIF